MGGVRNECCEDFFLRLWFSGRLSKDFELELIEWMAGETRGITASDFPSSFLDLGAERLKVFQSRAFLDL